MVLVTVSMLVFSTIATSYAQTQGAPSKKLRGSKVQKNTTQSGCHGSFCDGVPDQKFAVLLEKGIVSIHIGESKTANEKCVAHPTPVTCAKDAANPGKRLNDKNVDYGDKFAITVKKDSREVCAQRLDKNEGWGQPLKIACKDAQEKSDKCMCLTSAEGDCSCKGCTEDEQMQTCFELLGPCTCQRSAEAICDCSGYCHTRDERREACETEPGCQWSGMWCEAQVGLLWS
mmetsp:Transcript_121644/g.190859  ORF Transcript_121644/g.190859 Transcript_121644/m.190859 type:complete len:230 (-) Transcript_121644:66-755(-)